MPPNFLLSILSLLSAISPNGTPEPDPPDLSSTRPNTSSSDLVSLRHDISNGNVESDTPETPQQRKSRLQRERRQRQRLAIIEASTSVSNGSQPTSSSISISRENTPQPTVSDTGVPNGEESKRERANRLQRERRSRSRQQHPVRNPSATPQHVQPASMNTSQNGALETSLNQDVPETERERRTRLQSERRKRESEEVRARRLATAAQHATISRQMESDDERARRLATVAQHAATTRQMESDDERARRLATVAQHAATTRQMESEEERARRLTTDAQQTASARQMESEEERARRLTTDAQQTASARQMESVEERARRLATVAQHAATTRQMQTPTQVIARRTQERLRHRSRDTTLHAEPLGLSSNFVAEHFIGNMTILCGGCGAKYFPGEGSPRQDKYNRCCNFGSIHLDHFNNFPDRVKVLFTGSNPSSSNFRSNIRNYNSSLAMASMGAQITSPPGNGPYCYKVHGQVYHYVGALEPTNGASPKYGQLYIMDTKQAAEERMGIPYNSKCDPAVMKHLSEVIAEINVYSQSFKMMHKVALEEERRAAANNLPRPVIRMMFHLDESLDRRRYNIPDSNEVAAVFVGQDNDVPPNRSIAVHLTGGGLQKIKDIDKLCDPLVYPLFFPTGDFGWHPDMRKAPNDPNRKRTRITQREYYSYLLSARDFFNPILHGGKLFQQFVVDSWVKIEQNRLNYARTHQAELRCDSYQSLLDHVNTGVDSTVPGARIILPSSFSGTPRNMQQGYQDGMAIVTKYGKPDYFLTLTCNPKWKEIIDNLLPHQTASYRPDLVARVFNLKLKELLDDLLNKDVLGKVAAYILVVEWQKRGLPHVHMLITMTAAHKPRTAEHVNKVIRAFLPDPVTEPELFEIVSSTMIHRNCGVNNPNAPCMKDGVCTKEFPKTFQDTTRLNTDSFPLYYRPDDGRTVTNGSIVYDNRFVVPYNAYLSLKYNAHLNLEICSMLHAVKYLFKYVYKGIDRASLKLKQLSQTANNQPVDEISAHLDTRFICAPEAIHRIYEFDTQRKSHVIYRLQVHLPDHQPVVFPPANLTTVLANAQTKLTNLTAWFKINREFDPNAPASAHLPNPRHYLYINFPEKFTFVKTTGLWKHRERGVCQIGRMYMVSPKDRERFCLRLLLLHRKGMTSYEDLRTVNGRILPTFSEAAKAMDLLRDERHFEKTMTEAVVFKMPSELRSLFVAMLAFSDVQDAVSQWEKFKSDLSEDYLHKGHNNTDSIAHAYYDMLESASCMGLDLKSLIDPPMPYRPILHNSQLSVTDHGTIGSDMYSKLNPLQKVAADSILQPPRNNESSCFYVDGPGGSGKTYLYNCLYHTFMAAGKKVECVAWTGIASNLLPKGRTIHSLFKLSVPQDNRLCTMKNQSKEATLLRETDVFIFDECSMIPRWSLDAIDQLLRDVMAHDIPFGGKKLILGGDFRQVLPVVERGKGSDPVEACLKNSSLFNLFRKFTLSQNMRALSSSNDWSSLLLSIGNGTLEESTDGGITLPSSIMSEGDLLTEIFGNRLNDPKVFATRAILAPKNVDVNDMNEKVLSKLDGREVTFTSVDDVHSEDPDDAINFPPEFLHKQNPSGSPPHLLNLKIGAVIMLLRNLDVSKGLCNGTRFVVVNFSPRVIQCKFINGARDGSMVFIPRIDNYTEKGLPFRLRRRQFPVRLAFAMTINKSQGQSLTHVGLYLPEQVFGHGQFYVALSRSRTMEGVRVLSAAKTIKNVVEKSVL